MITDLNHKYKDKDPLETVKIINTFFINEGYSINIARNEQSNANTFWCHLELIDKKGKIILTSNGKGTTTDFSLASGHAELYERYCAGFQKNQNDLFDKYCNNYQVNHYYFSKNEKLLSFEEIYNSNNLIKTFFDLTGKENNSNFNSFIKKLNIKNNKLPCESFFNLADPEDILYFNTHLLNCMQGSDGLAAGNTIEEAIVQGMSEIYEHYVTDRLYYDNSKNVVYFQLNLEKMKKDLPQYLSNIIDKIKESGCYLYVYDLSYNFNLPVLLSIIIDNNHQVYLNTGSAPVFNIALERVLTEIYQGRTQFNIAELNKNLIKPYRNYSIEESILNNTGSFTMRNNYPEELLLNKQNISTYNHDIFLSGNEYTNIDLLKHYININLINDFKVYIKDLSLTKDMKAIRIFCINKVIFPWKYNIFLQINENIRKEILKIAAQLNQEQYCSDNYFNLLEQLELIMNDSFKNQNNIALQEFFNLIFGYEFLRVFPVSNLDFFFSYYDNQCLQDQSIDILEKNRYSYLYSLYLYKQSNKYTDEEIINIFFNGFKYSNYNEIKKDLENIQDKKYVIRKIFNILKE